MIEVLFSAEALEPNVRAANIVAKNFFIRFIKRVLLEKFFGDYITRRSKSQKFFLTAAAGRFIIACVGDVAQLGEHQVRNLGVKGSNPSVSTNKEISRREFKASVFYIML